MSLASLAPKRFFLNPIMPTPNGRLHLGHVAGPFLKTDVLARSLRRRGHQVFVGSGSDVHESHVLLAARNMALAPAEVCAHFHDAIRRDFAALNVHFDSFINPLDPAQGAAYTRFLEMVAAALCERGALRPVKETVLRHRSGTTVVGCWLSGDCPKCGAPAGSYFCEACGDHFSPGELGNARSKLRADEGAPESAGAESLFLRVKNPAQLKERLAGMGVPEFFTAIADDFLARRDGLVRFTNPGRWGVRFPGDEPGSDRVLFSYTALWPFALACGQAFADRTGGPNPFAADSGVTCVTAFGIDNTVPFLVAELAQAQWVTEFRPHDFFLTNFFYTLESKKFSTSRRHAIWAGDLVTGGVLPADAVRLYLGLTNPEFGGTNFDPTELVDLNNRQFAGAWDELFRDALATAGFDETTAACPDRLAERFGAFVARQDAALDPARFRLRESIRPLETWIADARRGDAKGNEYWWLKGFAALAFPWAPDLAGRIWFALGHDGEPTVAESFFEPRRPRLASMAPHFRPVRIEDVRACFA
jgi:methionyl-tRNA synthetase